MDNREEIILSPLLKGIVVYAVYQSKYSDIKDEWIILIESVKYESSSRLYSDVSIKRHVSYCKQSGDTHISKEPGCWGCCDSYKFYTATEEEKQIIKNIIKKYRLKYVKALNKLIDR